MPIDKLKKKSTLLATQAIKQVSTVDNLVIDWERVRQMMNGNLEEAKNLLTQLVAFVPKSLSKIRSAIKVQDYNKLLESVHKLHGACSYCGVPRLKNAAKQLESAIRSQEYTEINNLLPMLVQECKLFLKTAKEDKIINP